METRKPGGVAEFKPKPDAPFPEFTDNKIERASQHYMIVHGYKLGGKNEGGKRFFIVPLDDRAEKILKSAVEVHKIPAEPRNVKGKSDQSDKIKLNTRWCIRMDFSEENFRGIVCGDNLIEPGGEYHDTVPTLKRLEEVYSSGQPVYTIR